MLDQLLGTILFFLGLSGSVKGESTPSAMATDSAISTLTATLTNVLNPATKSSASVSITDIESYDALVSVKNPEWQKAWEQHIATFQKSVTALTNTAKKTSVLDIQDKLTSIKQTRISVMKHELDALQAAVDGMEEGSGTASGKLVTTLLPEAQTAIAKAAALLYTFSEKSEVITISSGEKNIKSDVQKVRKQMETDIKAIVAATNDARKKVKTAYDEYRKVTKKTVKISISSDSFSIRKTTAGGEKK